MSWANIDLNPFLPRHPKTLELESRVGDAAITYLIRLWCWSYEACPDGDLSKYRNPDFLERQVMGWRGESGILMKALCDLKWLDKVGRGGGKLLIHGWQERNSHVIAFKEKQRGNANKRWQKTLIDRQITEPQGARMVPDEDLADAKKPSGNASIHPSIHPHLPNPLIHPEGADDEGALAPGGRREITMMDIVALHRQQFPTAPTGRHLKAYKAALDTTGKERGRWEYAFSVAKQKHARTPDYIIAIAQNAEPKDWGAVELKGWPTETRGAAKLAADILRERMGVT